MTASAASLPLRAANVDDAVTALRQRGLRVSAARRLLLEVLYAADRAVSAEELAAGLAGRLPVSDLTSVYRNLETLEGLGLVRHVHLGHGPGLYAVAAGDLGYLVCESCGEVRAVEGPALDALRVAVHESSGYRARLSHFPLVGLCPACARTGAGAPANKS